MVATRSTSFDWSIKNVEFIQKKLTQLGQRANDLRIPFRLIASDWYRSNRKLFTLQSKGLYQDLAPSGGQDGNPSTTSNYKARKKKELGFVYPILVGKTRDLSNSLLSKNHKFSNLAITKNAMIMGSNDPKLEYHQGGGARTKIPQRQLVFIDGGPADRSSDSGINGRRERWTSIIDTHLDQLITGRIR